MSGISEKQRDKYFYSNWKMRLGAIQISLKIGNPFPDQNGFCGSIWWIWEAMIKNAHNQEETRIQTLYEEWKNQEERYSGDLSFDSDGLADDQYWETCRVTNSMYASLVVSMWSEMESFLKSMVSICSDAPGRRNEILKDVRKFCEDSLQGEKPKTTLDDCIGALKRMKEPYKFDEINKGLRAYGIEVEKCSNYTTVDAIRILNNSYKHSNGRYRPKSDKPHTHIDQDFLSKWKILKDQNHDEIDYSKLPIQEIVVGCNSFCSDLLERTEAVLDPDSAPSPYENVKTGTLLKN